MTGTVYIPAVYGLHLSRQSRRFAHDPLVESRVSISVRLVHDRFDRRGFFDFSIRAGFWVLLLSTLLPSNLMDTFTLSKFFAVCLRYFLLFTLDRFSVHSRLKVLPDASWFPFRRRISQLKPKICSRRGLSPLPLRRYCKGESSSGRDRCPKEEFFSYLRISIFVVVLKRRARTLNRVNLFMFLG